MTTQRKITKHRKIRKYKEKPGKKFFDRESFIEHHDLYNKIEKDYSYNAIYSIRQVVNGIHTDTFKHQYPMNS